MNDVPERGPVRWLIWFGEAIGLATACLVSPGLGLYVALREPGQPEGLVPWLLFVVGMMLVFGFVGMLAVMIFYKTVELVALSWLRLHRMRRPLPRQCPCPPTPQATTTADDLGGGFWGEQLRHCRESADRFHAIARAAAPSPGQQWLNIIATGIDSELAEAARVARYGYLLAPHGPDRPDRPGEPRHGEPGSTPARRAAHRLTVSRDWLAESAERAASIALDLSDTVHQPQIHAQLDVLAAQAPHLRDLTEA